MVFAAIDDRWSAEVTRSRATWSAGVEKVALAAGPPALNSPNGPLSEVSHAKATIGLARSDEVETRVKRSPTRGKDGNHSKAAVGAAARVYVGKAAASGCSIAACAGTSAKAGSAIIDIPTRLALELLTAVSKLPRDDGWQPRCDLPSPGRATSPAVRGHCQSTGDTPPVGASSRGPPIVEYHLSGTRPSPTRPVPARVSLRLRGESSLAAPSRCRRGPRRTRSCPTGRPARRSPRRRAPRAPRGSSRRRPRPSANPRP